MELASRLLRAAEQRFGIPREAFLAEEILPWEMDLIERVCGDHRFHDLTTFVLDRDSLALVRKPSEPPGVFWVPAGGLDPGEELEDGVRREVYEETGLDVAVERYLLRVEAQFSSGSRVRPWISHVFLAHPKAPSPDGASDFPRRDKLHPVDTKEVEEAAWITLSAFQSATVPLLRGTGWGRFRYRLQLAQLAFAELGLLPSAEPGGNRQ